MHMLQRVHFSASPPIDTWVTAPDNATLIAVLADCCHPRAGRLRQQLSRNPNPCAEEMAQIHRDARHVLCLSFGPVEASRRLAA